MGIVSIAGAMSRAVGAVENGIGLQLENKIPSKATLVTFMKFRGKCFRTWTTNFICGIHVDKRIHLLCNFCDFQGVGFRPIVQIDVVVYDFSHGILHIYLNIKFIDNTIVELSNHICIGIISNSVSTVSKVVWVLASAVVCRQV